MTIVIRNPSSRTARRGHAGASLSSIVLVVAWLLSGLLTASASAEVLRWKFKAGEVLHYSIDTKIQMSARGADRERKSNRTLTIDMNWTVLNVGPGDVAEITQRIDRVRAKVEQAPYVPFEFDSNSSKGVPDGFEEEAKHLKSMVGQEFTFSMKPSGEIGHIRLAENTLKAIREAVTGEEQVAEAQKSLMQMLLQSSPPSFPEVDVKPGKSWKSKAVRVPARFGIMVIEKTFTFQGPDPNSPHLLLVGIDSRVGVEPVAGVTTTIRKQEGKGSMTIDARSGHLISVRFTDKIDMTVTPTGGQPLAQTSETTSSMNLLP